MGSHTFGKDYRVAKLSTLYIDISENNHAKFKTEMTLLTIKAFRYRLTNLKLILSLILLKFLCFLSLADI